jgi:hypothetical protein
MCYPAACVVAGPPSGGSTGSSGNTGKGRSNPSSTSDPGNPAASIPWAGLIAMGFVPAPPPIVVRVPRVILPHAASIGCAAALFDLKGSAACTFVPAPAMVRGAGSTRPSIQDFLNDPSRLEGVTPEDLLDQLGWNGAAVSRVR